MWKKNNVFFLHRFSSWHVLILTQSELYYLLFLWHTFPTVFFLLCNSNWWRRHYNRNCKVHACMNEKKKVVRIRMTEFVVVKSKTWRVVDMQKKYIWKEYVTHSLLVNFIESYACKITWFLCSQQWYWLVCTKWKEILVFVLH